MHDKDKPTRGWKRKIADEMAGYFVDVLYLFLLLGVFALYKRLLLAEYQISYLHYGITLIEALVLGKILVVGRVLRLDRPLASGPLIYPTAYRAFIFALLVSAFAVVEAVIGKWIHGRRAGEGLEEFTGRGGYDLIGKCLVTFFALIPFFGLKAVGQELGEGKMLRLFFRSRTPRAADRMD